MVNYSLKQPQLYNVIREVNERVREENTLGGFVGYSVLGGLEKYSDGKNPGLAQEIKSIYTKLGEVKNFLDAGDSYSVLKKLVDMTHPQIEFLVRDEKELGNVFLNEVISSLRENKDSTLEDSIIASGTGLAQASLRRGCVFGRGRIFSKDWNFVRQYFVNL